MYRKPDPFSQFMIGKDRGDPFPFAGQTVKNAGTVKLLSSLGNDPELKEEILQWNQLFTPDHIEELQDQIRIWVLDKLRSGQIADLVSAQILLSADPDSKGVASWFSYYLKVLGPTTLQFENATPIYPSAHQAESE